MRQKARTLTYSQLDVDATVEYLNKQQSIGYAPLAYSGLLSKLLLLNQSGTEGQSTASRGSVAQAKRNNLVYQMDAGDLSTSSTIQLDMSSPEATL